MESGPLMGLAAGTELGSYEILSPLGQVGMDEVYLPNRVTGPAIAALSNGTPAHGAAPATNASISLLAG